MPEAIAGEVAYFKREDRASFERPYGIAWLLQLSGELRAWQDPQAQHGGARAEQAKRLAPAASLIRRRRIDRFHHPKVSGPALKARSSE